MVKKQFLIKYTTIISIILAIVLCIVALNTEYKTIKIQQEWYEDKSYFEGIYVMNEVVLKNGELNNKDLKIQNGDVVKKDKVLYENIRSPIQGRVFLYIDGAENKYTLNNIKNITKEDILSLKDSKKNEGIKIVDNTLWYMCIVANKDELKTLKKNKEMILEVNGEQYSCIIKDYFIKNENIFIVLSTQFDLVEFNLQRYFDGYIIKSRYYGYILPRESVVEYNGEKGVFIKKGEYVYFKPIKISHMDYKVCVTSDSTLKDNDEVVVNPKNLKDKQRIKR
ncbi:MAG: hypothetical protein JG776_1770 [Caloramator sp.]|uniref:HlyD family efflux transporter periplasmic adaptor subunit n=1 Tax=Caloramator sp. TaxID=1871330 RepID=UPI001D7275C5|nr:HlyD family efflux transporter periplasmic adaptor subunit [Caloramator sp.]MBZ4664055.1 hypothetical protein [Caloramator sp.]